MSRRAVGSSKRPCITIKTAKKRRLKVVRLLPVAGVIPGISGLNWAMQWLSKRAELGLRASMQQPTMPAPTWWFDAAAVVLIRGKHLGPGTSSTFGSRQCKNLATHSTKQQICLGCRRPMLRFHCDAWLDITFAPEIRVLWSIREMQRLLFFDKSKLSSLQ